MIYADIIFRAIGRYNNNQTHLPMNNFTMSEMSPSDETITYLRNLARKLQRVHLDGNQAIASAN
jgi:hypothetical protein